jgi:hypothetical protein
MSLPSSPLRSYGASASTMRRLLLAPVMIACALSLGLFMCAACDDTPRGEQGIDYVDDGGYYSVPGNDASDDVFAPCAQDSDAGICAQASSPTGTPATHLIVCSGGQIPVGISCVQPGDASVTDAGMFCCTTGLL